MKTSLRVALAQGAGDLPEHRAIEEQLRKAVHDREQAIRNVCKLFSVKDFDSLPAHAQSVIRNLLPDLGQ